MTYSIISFDIDENGRHSNYETHLNNLPTEESAISWLNSCRQGSINTVVDKYVTPVDYWCYNVLASMAKGDRSIKNYHITAK